MGFRTDIRDAFNTSMAAFAAANPTISTRHHKARPESLADDQGTFLAGIEEAYVHSAGVRQRTADVSVVYWSLLSDNEETADRLEVGADAVLDWLTANPHLIGTYTVQEPQRATPIELNEGGTIVPAVAITTRALIQEGRI